VSVVDSRIGSEIPGYRVEQLIGRGGMSSVYLAEHLRLHRKVALKILAAELAHDERFQERFLRESQLAASLDHPNIVPIFDADEADGVLYIAMRWVDGTDLRELLKRSGPLEPVRAIGIVGQAAAGLDAAHRRGLVHRDVKPGNILVGEDDHIYVSDFGLTKQASSQTGLTATGQLVGTVDYVAPEQIQGQQVDERADVYSLACVLYECLAGAKPYEKDTEVAILWAHMQDPPPTLSDKRPDLGREIDSALARGMAKEPADRYATCRELVDEARGALGISSGEIPRPIAAVAPRRRRWWLVAAAAAVVAAAAILAVVLLTRSSDGGGISSLPLNAVGMIDPQTNKLVASIPVGKTPVAIAYGLGSVWVANQDDGTITRIDAQTHAVQGTIGVGGTPTALAVGNGAVWVTTFEGQLFKIDPRLNSASQVPVRLTGRLGGIGSGTALFGVVAPPGAVWVLWTGGDEIARIDPSSGRVVKRVSDPNPSYAMALGSDAIWLGEPSSVSRLDLRTEILTGSAQIGVGTYNGYTTVAVGEGSVWAAKSGSGDVWQISSSSTTAVGRTLVGRATAHIATGEGSVWVTRPTTGTVVKIDPSTGKLVKTLAVGSGAYALTTGAGRVWVTTVQPGSPRDVPQDAG